MTSSFVTTLKYQHFFRIQTPVQPADKVCMFEYPRKGIWAIGFISTKTGSEIREKAGAGELYSIFVPTTPNPTSGFLLFVPQKDTIVLDMDVEDAAKLIISAGIVEPPQKINN